MHEDDHQSRDANESHANHIQTHSQPAHGAAEQIEGSLVLIQQLLIPGRKHTDKVHQPCSLEVLSFKEKRNKVRQNDIPVFTCEGIRPLSHKHALWSGPECWRQCGTGKVTV